MVGADLELEVYLITPRVGSITWLGQDLERAENTIDMKPFRSAPFVCCKILFAINSAARG
jgi:hypothetical protein